MQEIVFDSSLWRKKSILFLYQKKKGQNPDLFFTDYLDEEYVDLDWAEKTTTAESTMNSAAFHSSEWPRMTSAEANTEEGSGEAVGGEEIDDEDDQEGSSKNEAHLSEIAGSGDFGKKKHRKNPKKFQLFNCTFCSFHSTLNSRKKCTKKPNFMHEMNFQEKGFLILAFACAKLE